MTDFARPTLADLIAGTAELSLADWLSTVVRRHASSEAIVAQQARISYATLEGMMNLVAAALLDCGIGPGDRVALFFDQGPASWSALWGVWRAGAIAVPLTAAQPPARLRKVLEDCSPRLIVTDSLLVPKIRMAAGDGVSLIEIDRLSPRSIESWPAVRASDPAIILYTSGSDGTPKGVIQTHRNLLQKVGVCTRAFETTPADRFALFSTYAVGQGLITMLNALAVGAALCQFDVKQRGLDELAAWLEEERITIYVSSATLFRTLARALATPRPYPDLRLVRLSGERVTPADVMAHRRLFRDSARLLVSYSATETGLISMHFVDPEETFPDGVVPVGPPVEGMAVRVVDDQGRDLGDGEEGELIVRSAYLSPGYWGDAERTSTAFTVAAAEREYRTADVCRLRHGRLDHLGRKGFRVKIRGFRIELEDVEAALRRCADVQQAVVVARTDVHDDARLVAYVETASGSSQTADTLRAGLGDLLPDYSIPSTFVMVDHLPLAESGKIDRTRLPDPPRDRPLLSSAWTAPATPLEIMIATIWENVLEVDRVGLHDDFFSIGGDSLRATQVVARLGSALDRPISIGDILQASTVAEVAAVILRGDPKPGAPV